MTTRPFSEKYGEDFLTEYTADCDMKVLKLKANKDRFQGMMKSNSSRYQTTLNTYFANKNITYQTRTITYHTHIET